MTLSSEVCVCSLLETSVWGEQRKNATHAYFTVTGSAFSKNTAIFNTNSGFHKGSIYDSCVCPNKLRYYYSLLNLNTPEGPRAYAWACVETRSLKWKKQHWSCPLFLFLSHTHTPAELLDRAHIDDSIVEMMHKLGHVLVQKPLISMHWVSWEQTQIKCVNSQNHLKWNTSKYFFPFLKLLVMNKKTVCLCVTCQRTLAWWSVLSDEGQELILGLLEWDLAVPHCLRQPWLNRPNNIASCDRHTHLETLNKKYRSADVLIITANPSRTFPWCSLHQSDMLSSSSSGCLMIRFGPWNNKYRAHHTARFGTLLTA